MNEHDLPDWFMAIVEWVVNHPWLTLGIFVGSAAVSVALVIR